MAFLATTLQPAVLRYFLVVFLVVMHGAIASNGFGQSSSTATAPGDLLLSDDERAFLRSHPVIRVGNEDDWPPFDFSEHGVPKGYAIDYLKLLGSRLGVSFEFVNGHTWAELLELFRRGSIDLLPSLWISESRKQYMLFTEPYLTLPYVIVTGQNDLTITSFNDLFGRTVAVARGYIQEEVLESSFPEIELHRINNPLEGLKSITYGRADAYIGYRGVVDYLIATRFFTDLKIVGETSAPGLGPQGLHIAVSKEKKLLRDLLQKAMNSITEKEKVALSQRWISVKQRLFPDLTEEESAYLRNHPVLRVDNLMTWPPFNFNQNGSPKGFCVDYMRLLAEKLAIEVDFVSGPTWNEFMNMLQTGDLDLLIDVVETEKRRGFIGFTEPYLTIFSGVVYRRGDRQFADINDLAGHRVAVPKNFYYEELLAEYYPDIQVQTEDTILDCLKAVSAGQADAALAEKPVFDYLITKHFLTDLETAPIMNSIHFENTPVSIGARKDRTLLRDIMQKAMDTVSEEEMASLYNRWFEREVVSEQVGRVPLLPEEQNFLTGKREISMCVHPDWMPFEAIDENGRHIGIVAEIVSLAAEKIGIPVTLKATEDWQESLRAFHSGQCDMLSGVSQADEELGEMVFSKPYFDSVSVVVAPDEVPFISELEVLSGRRVAVVRDNPVADYIRTNYPAIDLYLVDDASEALAAIENGDVYAMIESLQVASYAIHRGGFYNLKIAGQTSYRSYLRIGISEDLARLKPILDKALDSITDHETDKIVKEWLSIRFEHSFDTVMLWKIFAGAAVVILIVLYWNRKLSRLNRKLGQAHEELELKSLELERLSITDSLTGLYNRMKLESILVSECKRCERSNHGLAVIMLDVDKFKSVNDTYGHHTGDRVLQELASILKKHIRSIDSVGRWGGEEFLLICPETEMDGAMILGKKLQRVIAGHTFEEVGRCTCSFGISAYDPGEPPDNLLIRVDQAMYQAKEEGRNRVIVVPVR